jgi:predicted nucleic acid-binding protein
VDLQFDDYRIVPFGCDEAQVAASLYRRVSRARPRLSDLAIAASAISYGAHLWTLNGADFGDIPELKLYAAG